MAYAYTFETPRIPIDAGIIQFFEDFYRISDTPDAHDTYIDQFTPDATFILASKVSNGTNGTGLMTSLLHSHIVLIGSSAIH